MKFISYPSTEQFRSTIKKIRERAQFAGYDEVKKEVILNKDAKMPIITFKGTVKLHGTQGAVVQDKDLNIYTQSRKNIVTPEKDNAGFSFFINSRKDIFEEYFSLIREMYKEDIISIYGEFCGGNIQRNIALNGLDKMFVIFAIKITPEDEDKDSFWIDRTILKTNGLIKNIDDFETFSVDIDFERPDIAQNIMLDLTTKVGDMCPVGKQLGSEGIGEGIVWETILDGERIIFKTKDERHAKGSGKVKTLKPVDSELEQKKVDFVNNIACTESRLDQMYTQIAHSVYNGDSSLMTMKDMGSYLKLVSSDVIKEELDIMSEQGLEPKMINSMISKVARDYFISRLDKEIGI